MKPNRAGERGDKHGTPPGLAAKPRAPATFERPVAQAFEPAVPPTF